MRIALVVLTLLTLGCGDSTGPRTTDLNGQWTFSTSYSVSSLSLSCNEAGQVNISQSGTNFTGTYTTSGSCTGPGGSVTTSDNGTITGGQINGSNVTFLSDGGCSFTGTLSGNNRMSGSISCPFDFQGQRFTASGTWQASR